MSDWPELDWPEWHETAQYLHLVAQMLGKIRLASTPWLNHGWHVALAPTARGLTTGPVPAGAATIQIDLDLVAGSLRFANASGGEDELVLGPGSIADVYARLVAILGKLGAPVAISTMPSELPGAVRFDHDHAERSWDGEAVRRFHRALLSVRRVFERFRTRFLGKASPVHFFWGSFDLAVTRFSGRTAPRHPGGVPGLPDAVTCEAYSHEEASAGFWPGSDAFPRAAFYAYAYPAPPGFAGAAVEPEAARFEPALGEFILTMMRSVPPPIPARC